MQIKEVDGTELCDINFKNLKKKSLKITVTTKPEKACSTRIY